MVVRSITSEFLGECILDDRMRHAQPEAPAGGCAVRTMTDDEDRRPPAFARFLLLAILCWAVLAGLAWFLLR